MWNFGRIPQSLHVEIIKAYHEQRYRYLYEVYNKYKVAGTKIPDCCFAVLVRDWTKYAIDKNLIHEANKT